MINLLPPKEKEWLILKKRERLLIVLGIIIAFALVCLVLILYALKFYLLQYATYQQALVEAAEKTYQVEDLSLAQEQISKYNATLTAASQFYKNAFSTHDALKTIYAISRPDGLSFITVAVELDKGKKFFKANVSGISATREALAVFKKNIEGNANIKNIYFPPSSWVKAKDLEFFVTFDLLLNPTP